jgi:hypothetical protein
LAKQRISYVPLESMDADMRKEMERCQREGTPRPRARRCARTSGRVLVLRQRLARPVHERRARPRIKELCRLYVSRSVQCEYCGNQRSVKSHRRSGMIEDT